MVGRLVLAIPGGYSIVLGVSLRAGLGGKGAPREESHDPVIRYSSAAAAGNARAIHGEKPCCDRR